MTEVPQKALWMGEDIDLLPREKLIEIIHFLNRQAESARASHKDTCELLAAIARHRRIA